MFPVRCAICSKMTADFLAEEEGWLETSDMKWLCKEHVAEIRGAFALAEMMGASEETLMEMQDPAMRERMRRAFDATPSELGRAAVGAASGFSGPEDGSGERYMQRRHDVPWARHTLWWIAHNAVAHPLIAFLPFGPLFRFHDWTSRKMHGR